MALTKSARKPLPGGAYWTRKGNARPNKLARGMQETSDRSGHRLKDGTSLSLAVHGTCDKLARMFNWNTKPTESKCPCCGQRMPRYVLSDHGRRQLAMLRRKALNRKGTP